jgi:hypothetical protein
MKRQEMDGGDTPEWGQAGEDFISVRSVGRSVAPKSHFNGKQNALYTPDMPKTSHFRESSESRREILQGAQTRRHARRRTPTKSTSPASNRG